MAADWLASGYPKRPLGGWAMLCSCCRSCDPLASLLCANQRRICLWFHLVMC